MGRKTTVKKSTDVLLTVVVPTEAWLVKGKVIFSF